MIVKIMQKNIDEILNNFVVIDKSLISNLCNITTNRKSHPRICADGLDYCLLISVFSSLSNGCNSEE
jgi:hypothetical protein